MIDVENEIFTIVSTNVREKYPDIFITGEYVRVPSSFPCVSLIEQSNTVYEGTSTSSDIENHAKLMYEVNIYSNKTRGKKSECKAIATLIDTELLSLGLNRIMLQPIPNMDDATIYRMTGRYEGVISKNKTIYRR